MERHENYFVWLFNQLKGWPVQNYCLWFFAFGFQLALLIQAKVTSVTLLVLFWVRFVYWQLMPLRQLMDG